MTLKPICKKCIHDFEDGIHTNGGHVVADAFMRIYGVDIKKAGALNGI